MSDVLSTIDSCVSDTKGVIKDLEDFSKSVSKLKDAGTSIKKLKNIIDSNAFSKISAGFSGASALLGVISMFTGGKSSTQQILDAISGIDNKIDNLEDLIVGKFDLVLDKISDDIRVTGLLEKCSHIDAAVAHFKLYLTAENDDIRSEAISHLCNESTTQNLYSACSLILDELEGKLHADQKGIMSLRSDSANGDAKAVIDLYNQLFRYAQSAMVICSFIKIASLLSEKNIPLADLSSVREQIEVHLSQDEQQTIGSAVEYDVLFYQPVFNELQNDTDTTVDNCLKNAKENITKYLDVEVLPRIKTDESTEISKEIIANLEKKYSWLGHAAITYDAMTGFTKHIVSGSGNGGYVTFFRKKLHGKTEKNIVSIYTNPDKSDLDADKLTRNIEITYMITPTHGMVPKYATVRKDAEQFDWNKHNMSLKEAVSKIRKENNNSKAIIWMGKRHSHTHCEVSNNVRVTRQWHYSKDSPYSIGIFE